MTINLSKSVKQADSLKKNDSANFETMPAQKTPIGIKIIGWLMIIGGSIMIITSIFMILSVLLMPTGILSLLLAILPIVVGWNLLKLKTWALYITLFLTAADTLLTLTSFVFPLYQIDTDKKIVSLIINGIMFVYLWQKRKIFTPKNRQIS